MISAALERGITPVDDAKPLFTDAPKPDEPLDPGTRAVRIETAIEAIFDRNNPDEFTTGATPKVKAVQKESGIPKISASEIGVILAERNEKLEAMAQARNKQDQEETAAADEDPPDNEDGR